MNTRSCLFFFGLIFSIPSQATTEKQQNVNGAGPSTAITTLFFDYFPQQAHIQEYDFQVNQEHQTHLDGIQNSQTYLFGRSERPLNQTEKDQQAEEILLARIPIAFLVRQGINLESISIGDINRIITGKYTNWSQLGGADKDIEFIGRDNSNPALNKIKQDHYFFKNAKFNKTLADSNDLKSYLNSPQGSYSISFGVKSNFPKQKNYPYSAFLAA